MSDKHETKLDDLLRFTDKQKASDLHLSSELPPMIRVMAILSASTCHRWTASSCAT